MRDMPPLSDDILQSVSPPTATADVNFGAYLMYICQQHQWQPPAFVTEAATAVASCYASRIDIIIIIIINKVLIKVTLNKVIAGALYIVICG